MIYFTSDAHFGHSKNFIYGPRGFQSIQEHDETIIQRWNSVVTELDTVYFLGDAIMGIDHEYGLNCLRRLNGDIVMIRGNHDTTHRWEEYEKQWPHLILTGYSYILKAEGWKFYLCHYILYFSYLEQKFLHVKLNKYLMNLSRF